MKLIPSRPFKYNSGFSAAETVDASWITNDGACSDSDSLDVPCNPSSEWLLVGAKFQIKNSSLCFFGNWRRVAGYGAPITCFVIRESTGDSMCCSLFIFDYVTVDRKALETSHVLMGTKLAIRVCFGIFALMRIVPI